MNTPEPPKQLADARARIEQANDDYISFVKEMNNVWYELIGGMLKGFDGETENYVMQLPNPRKLIEVKGKPNVFAGQVVENLRSALDYMVFELSELNDPNLKPTTPEFVIAKSESDFRRRAEKRLKHLTEEQRGFVEQLQPYRGNWLLGVLAKMAGAGKHRRLLTIRDTTGFDIYFAPLEKQSEYQGCFGYPVGKGSAVFARPKGRLRVVLMEKYDATELLKSMIEHVGKIVEISFCFFEGRPLKLTIVR